MLAFERLIARGWNLARLAVKYLGQKNSFIYSFPGWSIKHPELCRFFLKIITMTVSHGNKTWWISNNDYIMTKKNTGEKKVLNCWYCLLWMLNVSFMWQEMKKMFQLQNNLGWKGHKGTSGGHLRQPWHSENGQTRNWIHFGQEWSGMNFDYFQSQFS